MLVIGRVSTTKPGMPLLIRLVGSQNLGVFTDGMGSITIWSDTFQNWVNRLIAVFEGIIVFGMI